MCIKKLSPYPIPTALYYPPPADCDSPAALLSSLKLRGGIEGRKKGQWSDDEQMHHKNTHIKNRNLTLFPRHCTSRRPPSAIPPLLSSLRWSCAEGLKEGRKGSDQMTSKCIIKNKNIKNNILALSPRHCTSPPPAVHDPPAALLS